MESHGFPDRLDHGPRPAASALFRVEPAKCGTDQRSSQISPLPRRHPHVGISLLSLLFSES